jgi:hypothetical protein
MARKHLVPIRVRHPGELQNYWVAAAGALFSAGLIFGAGPDRNGRKP